MTNKMTKQEADRVAELQRQRSLQEHQHAYEATDNPMFAWEALAYLRADEPPPTWVQVYLVTCTRALIDLVIRSPSEPELSAADAVRRIPAALGFIQGNRNMIEERRQVDLDSEILVADVADQSAGVPQVRRLGNRAQAFEKPKRSIGDARRRGRKVWEK